MQINLKEEDLHRMKKGRGGVGGKGDVGGHLGFAYMLLCCPLHCTACAVQRCH